MSFDVGGPAVGALLNGVLGRNLMSYWVSAQVLDRMWLEVRDGVKGRVQWQVGGRVSRLAHWQMVDWYVAEWRTDLGL